MINNAKSPEMLIGKEKDRLKYVIVVVIPDSTLDVYFGPFQTISDAKEYMIINVFPLMEDAQRRVDRLNLNTPVHSFITSIDYKVS